MHVYSYTYIKFVVIFANPYNGCFSVHAFEQKSSCVFIEVHRQPPYIATRTYAYLNSQTELLAMAMEKVPSYTVALKAIHIAQPMQLQVMSAIIDKNLWNSPL